MAGEVKQRHHLKAILYCGGFFIIVLAFVMWLQGQAQQQPVPEKTAVNDIKSTDWKTYGVDGDGEHSYRFDDSGKAFPDVLSVKTKMVYSQEGKKKYMEKRQKNRLSTTGFDDLHSRTVLFGLNCVSKNREICVLEVFELSKDGKTLDYAKSGSYKQWNQIPPGSVYDKLANVVCPEQKN